MNPLSKGTADGAPSGAQTTRGGRRTNNDVGGSRRSSIIDEEEEHGRSRQFLPDDSESDRRVVAWLLPPPSLEWFVVHGELDAPHPSPPPPHSEDGGGGTTPVDLVMLMRMEGGQQALSPSDCGSVAATAALTPISPVRLDFAGGSVASATQLRVLKGLKRTLQGGGAGASPGPGGGANEETGGGVLLPALAAEDDDGGRPPDGTPPKGGRAPLAEVPIHPGRGGNDAAAAAAPSRGGTPAKADRRPDASYGACDGGIMIGTDDDNEYDEENSPPHPAEERPSRPVGVVMSVAAAACATTEAGPHSVMPGSDTARAPALGVEEGGLNADEHQNEDATAATTMPRATTAMETDNEDTDVEFKGQAAGPITMMSTGRSGEDPLADTNDERNNIKEQVAVHEMIPSPKSLQSRQASTIETTTLRSTDGELHLQEFQLYHSDEDSKASLVSFGYVESITPFKAETIEFSGYCGPSPASTMSPGSPVGADFREMVSEATASATPFVRMTKRPTNGDASPTSYASCNPRDTPAISAGPSLASSDVNSTDETPIVANATPGTHLHGDASLMTPQVVPTTTPTRDCDLARQSTPLPSVRSRSASPRSNGRTTNAGSDSGDGDILQSNTPRTRRILEWMGPDAVDVVTWPVPSMATTLKSTNTPERQLPTPLQDRRAAPDGESSSPRLHTTPQHLWSGTTNPRSEIPDWWIPRAVTGSSGSTSSPVSLPSLLGASSCNEVSDLESPMFLARHPLTYKFSEEESDIESQSTRIDHECVADQASDIYSSGGNETTASSMQNTASDAAPSLQSMISALGYPTDEERSSFVDAYSTKAVDVTGPPCSASVCTSSATSCATNDPNATIIISNLYVKTADGSNDDDSCSQEGLIAYPKATDGDAEAAGTFDTLSPSVSSSSRRFDDVRYIARPWFKTRSFTIMIVFILFTVVLTTIAAILTRPDDASQGEPENQSDQDGPTTEVDVSEHPDQSPTPSPTFAVSNPPAPTSWSLTSPPIANLPTPTEVPTIHGDSVDTSPPQSGDEWTWNRIEEGEGLWRAIADDVDFTHPKWFIDTPKANNSDGIPQTDFGIHIQVMNAAEDRYLTPLRTALDDYSSSQAVASSNLTTVPYQELCEPEAGKIKVCNGDYGDTDWMGSTILFLYDNWIVAATIRINSSQSGSESSALLQYTLCHQLGHALGLPHSTSGSCLQDFGMAFVDESVITSQLQHPDAGDLDYLVTLYGSTASRHRRVLQY